MNTHKLKYQKGKFQNLIKSLIKNAETAYPSGSDNIKKSSDSYAQKSSKNKYSKKMSLHKKLRPESIKKLGHSNTGHNFKRKYKLLDYLNQMESSPNALFEPYSHRFYANI